MSSSFATARTFLRSIDSWHDFCTCMSLYGPQIVLLACLSAVTIYRRELSCNRGFHERGEAAGAQNLASEAGQEDDDEEEGYRSGNDDFVNDETMSNENETEKLLDSAGLYCSGTPLLAMVSIWLSCFDDFERDNDGGDNDSDGTCDRHETHSNNLWTETASPADFLDRVGNYCSGEPLIAAAQYLWSESPSTVDQACKSTPIAFTKNDCNSSHASSNFDQRPQREEALPFQQLPPDAHVQIASFLHPKDVVTMSIVSRSFRDVVDRGETSMAIWKTLWYRDYAWVIHSWDVGQEAFRRSKSESKTVDNIDCLLSRSLHSKDFYFLFGQAYSDYVLAGQNTRSRCLVSIYSNIYDITSFLDTHPGSPDTLMVHAGKDATTFFEDMGHSLVARRMARSLCVVIDASSTSCSADESTCGLHPTTHTKLSIESATSPPLIPTGGHLAEDIPMPNVLDSEQALLGRKLQQQQLQQQRRKKRRTGTLLRIRKQYLRDRERNLQLSHERYSSLSFLNRANPYFDPFCQQWKCWYTDSNLQVVFVSKV